MPAFGMTLGSLAHVTGGIARSRSKDGWRLATT